MGRTYVVTGAASGVGAATTRWLRDRGDTVIGSDLHDADVIADLATADGREALVDGVTRLAGGRIDGVVANAGGGRADTMLQLNYFGTVATLTGLRPLLAASPAPRAVAVSSISSLDRGNENLIEACLAGDEAAAIATAQRAFEAGGLKGGAPGLPVDTQAPLALYGAAKGALQIWCRRTAAGEDWAGAGINLNIVALGFYDTPAAAYVLTSPEVRPRMERLVPLRGAFPGSPDQAAALLSWLVGPENAQVTGQIIYADGGYEVRVRGRRAAA